MSELLSVNRVHHVGASTAIATERDGTRGKSLVVLHMHLTNRVHGNMREGIVGAARQNQLNPVVI